MEKKFKIKDITNKKFNNLLAIEKMNYKKYTSFVWKFVCDCGKEVYLPVNRVVYGNTKSCGCRRINKARERLLTHGKYNNPIHKVWINMLSRCRNEKATYYKYYGGRGINVCKKWYKFENFYNDMYESYLKHTNKFGRKQTTLDRINNNGNYNKKNCRWATYSEQGNNKRDTIKIKNKTISYWSKKLKISSNTIHQRKLAGWSEEKIINTKLKNNGLGIRNKKDLVEVG